MDQRMNYDSMKAMSDSFKKAAQQIEETKQAMAQVANQMEQGALQGTGGDLFKSALQEKLSKKLDDITQSMNDMSSNIDGAVEKIRDGVATAKSRFA